MKLSNEESKQYDIIIHLLIRTCNFNRYFLNVLI